MKAAKVLAWVCAFTCLAGRAHASTIPLTNADFATGNLTGWTTFVTANGVANAAVASFDVDGDTVATNAARFGVGQVIFNGSVYEGGGILQNFLVPIAGTLTIGMDIAAQAGNNGSGGLFRLFVDLVEVATFDFGPTVGIERSALGAVLPIVAGLHELRIQITRPFLPGMNNYLDDVTLDLQADGVETVPEPATLALLSAGLCGLVARRRRARQTA